MKIAGTIQRFIRRVLRAKLFQQTFIKKRPGRLDTPHLIFKSHKTMYSEQRSLQQFLRISFSFCFLFLPQHMEGSSEHFSEKQSYAQTHWGMRLMHDGATSLTERKTVNLRSASKQS